MFNYIENYLVIHIYPLVRFCQDGIINLRPTVLKIIQGCDASFEAQLRAERGSHPPQLGTFGCSRLWVAGSGCPFLFWVSHSLFENNQITMKNILIKWFGGLVLAYLIPTIIWWLMGLFGDENNPITLGFIVALLTFASGYFYGKEHGERYANKPLWQSEKYYDLEKKQEYENRKPKN